MSNTMLKPECFGCVQEVIGRQYCFLLFFFKVRKQIKSQKFPFINLLFFSHSRRYRCFCDIIYLKDMTQF